MQDNTDRVKKILIHVGKILCWVLVLVFILTVIISGSRVKSDDIIEIRYIRSEICGNGYSSTTCYIFRCDSLMKDFKFKSRPEISYFISDGDSVVLQVHYIQYGLDGVYDIVFENGYVYKVGYWFA